MQRLFRSATVPLLAVLVLVAAQLVGFPGLGGPTTVHAQGFIDFEDGVDRQPLQSTIPGLQFTTTDGQDWLYADWRTGGYNGPYPSGGYFSNGNFFAWLGESQGDGRIDFTQGDATYLRVGVSTLNVVRLRGYDSNNNVIAEASITGGNTGTGRLDPLSIEAPSGQTFRYVIVSGDANYWLIDDLSTDAAGVPGNPPRTPDRPRRDRDDPALISVVQRPDPNIVSRRSDVDFGVASLVGDPNALSARGVRSLRVPDFAAFQSQPDDGIVDYVIEATNRGEGGASNAVIALPFDPQYTRLIDATFSTEAAYVSRIITDVTPHIVEIQTGPIAEGSVVTATVRLLTRPDVPDGTNLGQRLSYTWTDDRSGGTGTSNLPILVAGGGDVSSPYYPVVVYPEAVPAGTDIGFGTGVFKPGESVAYWYNTPDGQAVELGNGVADENGAIAVGATTTDVAPGAYSIVFHGAWSNFTAVGNFVIE